MLSIQLERAWDVVGPVVLHLIDIIVRSWGERLKHGLRLFVINGDKFEIIENFIGTRNVVSKLSLICYVSKQFCLLIELICDYSKELKCLVFNPSTRISQ